MRRFQAHRRMALLRTGLSLLLITNAVAGVAQENDAATREAQWRHFPEPVAAPRGAPNVLLILTDDVGFGSTSTFGGPIPTPHFDALAQSGLRYNAFHTTAMCSPTRAALLTGRNAHAVASGSITNVAVDEPGYTSVIPDSAATLGRVLRDNGYDTAFFGKNHNTPVWQTGPLGPFDNWPNAWGFDYFYGFNGAASDQFRPALIENRNQVEPPNNSDYIFDRDMTDQALQWLEVQGSTRPDHPFLMYLSPGTMHSPHQAPPEWIARFKGKFDMGWDELRMQSFARQKQMGIIPADARPTPRPDVLPAWDSLSPEARKTYAHQMEVAAAQLAYFDHQTGRIFDHLRRTGQFENTLVIYIQGDNGASMDSRRGAVQELASLIGIEPIEQELIDSSHLHGTPRSYSNYNAAWAWAQNAPFPWGKQLASQLGGLRDGLVISWPKRIKPDREVRTQFHHVIDIAPTIYEAAGITPPAQVDGVMQQPIDGVSMVYTFDRPNAPSARREQYFEMLGHRSYYKDGWFAATAPRPPFERGGPPVDPMTFEWQLYDLRADFTQSNDVADEHPEKLAELQAAFETAAREYDVHPIQGNLLARVGAENRPSALGNRNNYVFYPGETRYPAGSFPALAIGWDMTASFGTAGDAAGGPIVVIGDEAGGLGLLLDDGRPTFVYNPSGRERERQLLIGPRLPAGTHEITISVRPDPEARERAAEVVMLADGRPMASMKVPIYYASRGEGVVGRYGTRRLLPDLRMRASEGLIVDRVVFRQQ